MERPWEASKSLALLLIRWVIFVQICANLLSAERFRWNPARITTNVLRASIDVGKMSEFDRVSLGGQARRLELSDTFFTAGSKLHPEKLREQ
jgi:hypothetical protein